MKVSSATKTETIVRLNIEELTDILEGRTDRRNYGPETTLTSAFMGVHNDKYGVYHHVTDKGIIDIFGYIVGKDLLVRFMSLETRTRENFFMLNVPRVMEGHEGDVTIELDVIWGLMQKRIIRIERKVRTNGCTIITLSLASPDNLSWP